MHPDEAALRRAVCASPDDDLPRLVFADYLEERGDARRAQFIRLQCEQARELWGTPRWAELGRLAAAVAPDRDGWRDTLGGLADGGEFVRGFVGRAAVTPGVFVSRGADLFDREPVQSVRVTGPADPGDDWARVVASPHVARVRELDLGRVDMTHLDLDRLARAGTLAHLTGLTLGRGRFDWGTGHVVDLLAALPNLTRLSRPGGGWGGEHLRALLTRPPADRLTTLEVTGGAGAITTASPARRCRGRPALRGATR